MALPILSADDRLREQQGIKGCIFGEAGIGKTSLLWTLPENKTLFVDLEAGDLAIEGWKGHTLRPQTWEECRDYAVFIGGPNPSLREDQDYSQHHFDKVCKVLGNPHSLDRYETIFIDSITVAARLCFQWCKGEPQAFSEKTGKPDNRGAYGLHGQEMIAWLTHLQHTRNKNIWFVGILEDKVDDLKRRRFQPQIEGNKTTLELPGIVDQLITMAGAIEGDTFYRFFVCHTLNPDGYPAKDRSGRLGCIEEAHLGRLMDKIQKPLLSRDKTLRYGLPHQNETQHPHQHSNKNNTVGDLNHG